EDPLALAAALNDMTPGEAVPAPEEAPPEAGRAVNAAPAEESPPPATEPVTKTAVAERPVAAPAAETSTPPAAAVETPPEPFIEAQKNSAPLIQRIQPDKNLPAIIAEIEKKAFEGVPEA